MSGRFYKELLCGCMVSEDGGGGLIPCCYEPEDETQLHRLCLETYYGRDAKKFIYKEAGE